MSPITQTSIPLSDEWSTPEEVFAPLNAEFGFTVDAASEHWNAKLHCHWTRADFALERDWRAYTVWLNPPYSDIGSWLAKAYRESRKGATVVALVPCTPDRHWWADHVEGKAEVRLLTRSLLRTGRIHFQRKDGTSGRAPFPSAILIYRP